VTVSLPVTLAALIDRFVPVLLLWRGGSRRNNTIESESERLPPKLWDRILVDGEERAPPWCFCFYFAFFHVTFAYASFFSLTRREKKKKKRNSQGQEGEGKGSSESSCRALFTIASSNPFFLSLADHFVECHEIGL